MDLISVSNILQAQEDRIVQNEQLFDDKVSQLKQTVEENNIDVHQKIDCIMKVVTEINQKLSANSNSPPVTPTQVFPRAVLNPVFEGDGDGGAGERSSENS